MIFKLHYFLTAAGANALGILLGVFLAEYTDGSSTEIGFVYMLMPFCTMLCRPVICSLADQKRAHRRFLIILVIATAIFYLPFVIIPMLGPDIYIGYPRICWYAFLIPKVAGDISFSGVISIGDSLAINYASRINADYSFFRRWATISWMTFGVVTGHINEIWFLPKYVPAFMILISASLINAFVIWLWPAEYFVIVPRSQSIKTKPADKAAPNKRAKALLPPAVVWAHAKGKLLSVLACRKFEWDGGQPCDGHRDSSAAVRPPGGLKPLGQGQKGDQLDEASPQSGASTSNKYIDRATQMKILVLLIKRDPRILLYALVFIFAGFSLIPVSYFFMHLAKLCHHTGRCDYSQLAGLLQVSMALGELTLFIYVKRMVDTWGRLNTLSIAFLLVCLKYAFYGTVWLSVNPYFSLLSEVLQGFLFGIYITLMVEMAHFFSSEVELLIPELVERNIVPSAADPATCERLKMSLAATMQALMSSSNDGIGRGFGALLYGFLLDHYSFQTLWRIVATGAACVLAALQMARLVDSCLKLNLGLDQKFRREMEAAANGAKAAANAAKPATKTSRPRSVCAQSNKSDLDSVSIQSKDKISAEAKIQQVA